MPRLLPPLVLLLLLCLSACERPAAPTADGPMPIAVSIEPHAWLVSRIGGDRVRPIVLVPTGASPATYSPSDRQVSEVMASRVYFHTGVPFEQAPWFDALAGSKQLRLVDLRDGVTLREIENHVHHDHSHGHDHSHTHDHDHHHDCSGDDPHIWLSPKRLTIQAHTIANTLADLDRENAVEYAQRHAALAAELEALDAELTAQLAPMRDRAFYVFHPAWGYFADDYGLRQVAVEVAGRTPTDAELTELQRSAKADGATVLFVQPQIAPAGADRIAASLGATVQQLDPLRPDVIENLREVATVLERGP